MEPFTCPRCGGGIPNNEHRGAHPGALSRVDNETEICSDCGTKEAYEVFVRYECGLTSEAEIKEAAEALFQESLRQWALFEKRVKNR
jgi:hypothetical protein